MRLLLATHFFPYPPHDGGHIGYFNPIKYLSRRHEIVLVSLVEPEDGPNIEAMQHFCRDIVTMVPASSGKFLRLTRGVFSEPPGTASKYFFKEFGELLRATIQRHNPDLVELQHLNMAAYSQYCDGVPVILREHNAEYRVWERYAEQQSAWYRRLFFERMARRVRDYEGRQAERVAHCIAVSESDAGALRTIAPAASITTIASGVDTEYFIPADEVSEAPYSMVMTGSFAWKPKQHNLLILATEIFPRIKARIPEATLSIVGQGIPDALRRLVEAQGVTVTGGVPDVRPYVHRAALVLNYLEAGGGISLKVLEARFPTKRPGRICWNRTYFPIANS